MKGKLIVLEGIDGSGKSTQYARLCERLEKEHIKYHRIVFPRYSEESSSLIRMYLNGDFGGNPADVNAYAASTFFAVDRYASYKMDWQQLYDNGGLVVADRYTTSNACHQGSKLPDSELSKFFDWLYDFEYRLLGLPAPDLVVYLDTEIEVALRQLAARQKCARTEGDIHEKDAAYLRECLRAGRKAAAYYGWKRLDCVRNGVSRNIGEIHGEVFAAITEAL